MVKPMKPQRQRVKTIEGGPQGEGAVIEILMPTIKESQDHQAHLIQLANDEKTDEANEEANKYFAAHVKSWNWVDDDGNDLKDPSDPTVFEELLPDELVFITLALNGQDGAALTRKKK